MGKRDALVEAYMEALPARTVFVLAGPGGRPSKIASDSGEKLDIVAEFWFAKAAHADLVWMRVQSNLQAVDVMHGEGWIDLPAREVRDTIVGVAADLGASWCTADEVRAQASIAVEKIITHVEHQRREGGLAQVNATYKIYRQQQIAKGEKAIPYSAHLAAFTRSLVTLAAQNS
jgi:hypothetical protein